MSKIQVLDPITIDKIPQMKPMNQNEIVTCCSLQHNISK